MSPTSKYKPFSEMTPEEKEEFLRRVKDPQAVCLHCKCEYSAKKGVSGFCPKCVAAHKTTCC